MNILISGGSGFLGKALTQSFLSDGHSVYILTRSGEVPGGAQPIEWDAKTTRGWGERIHEMDVVVHLAGKSLSSFPWTAKTKQAFYDSRVQSGKALAEAFTQAKRKPRVFVQASGINYYGTSGETADELTPPSDDFLARLTLAWEAATDSVQTDSTRRIILRTSVVLGAQGGILPLMALPARLLMGGPIGNGKFAVPWIHLRDWVGAARFLIENESAGGAYNLVSPQQTSNAEFNRALAAALHRPYWLPTPAFLLRALLGEMSVLITAGRFARPKRLLDAGYHFQFEDARAAFADLL
ncbi:MAG: TIGR01777 family oxidoreductase [Anaerolineales bacterium]